MNTCILPIEKKVFVDLIDLYIRLINRIDKKYLLIKKLLITFEMSLCLIHLNTQLSLVEVFFRTQLFESWFVLSPDKKLTFS